MLALFQNGQRTFGDPNGAEQLNLLMGTPSFYKILQIKAAEGRTFTDDEGEQGKDQKVMLSHGFWTRKFAGNRSIIGQTIQLSGAPFEVVGVMPEGFNFLRNDLDLFLPLVVQPATEERPGAPQQQLPDDRPAARRGLARAGAPAGGCAQPPERRAVSQLQGAPAEREFPHRLRHARRRRHPRREGRAVHPLGRRVRRAAHRHREHHEPAHRAIERADARDGDAPRDRRQHRRPGPPARDRDDGAGPGERRARPGARLVAAEVRRLTQSHAAPARLRDRSRLGLASAPSPG